MGLSYQPDDNRCIALCRHRDRLVSLFKKIKREWCNDGRLCLTFVAQKKYMQCSCCDLTHYVDGSENEANVNFFWAFSKTLADGLTGFCY